MNSNNINIEQFEYNDVAADLYYPKASGKFPLIIISHGFKGWKRWGFIPYTAQSFASKGAIVICIDYSKNGSPDQDGFITKIHDFAENNVSTEINDLQNLIKVIRGSKIDEFNKIENLWNSKINLAGHSLGGAISLIVANQDNDINKVALWGSIAKFDRYTERQKLLWKEKGYSEFINQSTNQFLRINYQYMEDIEINKEKNDLIRIMSNFNRPVLLLHGKQDITVPVKEIMSFIENTNNDLFKYQIIEKTGHLFGVTYPFTSSNPQLEKLISLSSDFFDLNNN